MRMPTLALAVVLVAVGSGVGASRHQEETSTQVVARLYRDYAWETQDNAQDVHRNTLMYERREVMARYLDPALIELVLKDHACQERNEGICNLDFVPIWDSQDPGGARVTSIAPGSDQGTVKVKLLYGKDHVVPLTYKLVRTPRGWRIHDIVSPEAGSLVKTLRQ